MNEREIEYTLRDLLGLLKRRIGTVIIIALLISAFFIFIALASHPVYIAKGSIQLVSNSNNLGLLGDLQKLAGGDAEIGSEIEIVRSRTVANAVIEEMNLRLKIEDVTYGGPFTRGFGFVFGDRLQRDLRSFRVENVSFPEESVEKKYIVTFTNDSGGFKIKGSSGELGTGTLGQVFKSDALTFTPTVVRGSKGSRFKLQPKDAWRTLLDFQDTLNATTLGGATRTNLIGISYRSADP
ncbi:MAG: Wzz/FepE/Etk N-terminal domain-containing protein, partial [bacterium]